MVFWFVHIVYCLRSGWLLSLTHSSQNWTKYFTLWHSQSVNNEKVTNVDMRWRFTKRNSCNCISDSSLNLALISLTTPVSRYIGLTQSTSASSLKQNKRKRLMLKYHLSKTTHILSTKLKILTTLLFSILGRQIMYHKQSWGCQGFTQKWKIPHAMLITPCELFTRKVQPNAARRKNIYHTVFCFTTHYLAHFFQVLKLVWKFPLDPSKRLLTMYEPQNLHF